MKLLDETKFLEEIRVLIEDKYVDHWETKDIKEILSKHLKDLPNEKDSNEDYDKACAIIDRYWFNRGYNQFLEDGEKK